MTKLLILSRQAAEYERLVTAAELPGLEITALTQAPEGGEWEIVFGEPSLIGPLLSGLPRLRWVQATWAGVELLLQPGLRRDYTLTNARGVFGAPMAEYVFGYLLAHERRMRARWQAQQERRWDHTPSGLLRGKRLGLLGVGSIGAHLARTARAFGLSVWGYTRQSETCPEVERYFHGPQRLDFARGLDYLAAVLPNTPGTRRLVDADFVNALPAHAVLINAGRGSSVDEAALDRALRAGRLAAAVLDVFEQEPLPPDHFFWDTPNLTITNHTAALTHPPDMAEVFIDNCRRWLRGEPVKHQVDFEQGY